MSIKSAFTTYLQSTNIDGSGKAASYLRALELLEKMLHVAPSGFEDCYDIWSVSSAERLILLRLRILQEQKRGSKSLWRREGIPVSYLRDGYCSAALTLFIEFQVQRFFSEKVLDIVDAHKSDESNLVKALSIAPSVP